MDRDPDLALEGLSIWIEGREFPHLDDYWDGNWLKIRATMKSAGSSVSVAGPILRTEDFERFRGELATLHKLLTGGAELASYEINLRVKLEGNGRGQIAGEVEITPDTLAEWHRFETAGFDQTYLPAIIWACDAILEQYPVVGSPR